MNKTYLIINPFPSSASHGIQNYTINLIAHLEKNGIKYDYLANDKKEAPAVFRKTVCEYVSAKYGYEEVIIEAPESRASTLLVDDKYPVHVRLHAPSAVAQKYNGSEIDQTLFAEEMMAIHKAKYVSSPSYGLIRELKTELGEKKVSVFKNPFSFDIDMSLPQEKVYDIIFMGRFQALKGVEYINPLLERMEKGTKVVLMGNNASKFKLSPKVQCQVELIEEIAGPERFEFVKRSKALVQLSKFENCSMVVLESMACGTTVFAWDVGGNKELGHSPVIEICPNENVDYMANAIKAFLAAEYPDQAYFNDALKTIEDDFISGIRHIVAEKNGTFFGMGMDAEFIPEPLYYKQADEETVSAPYQMFGERIFGFSISNEHIEEMWMPIVDKFGSDYQFVCRRPLGFMYKFNRPFPVDKEKFFQYDWMKFPNLLIDHIAEYKPNKIFYHNGIHPDHQAILDRVKKAFPKIPIVYSELGWFPQQGNIYFDPIGTNGKSKIAQETFEEFCQAPFPPSGPSEKLPENGIILVVTQLENDTNLLVNSNRFKKMENFVSYVIQEVGHKGKIVIKTHPLDNEKQRFEKYASDNVEVIHEGGLGELLSRAKAVVGINSTVLMEALKYKANIYAFGDGLLNNKRVVIECKNESLLSLWSEEMLISQEAKLMVVNEFIKRQINIEEFYAKPLSESIKEKSILPLLRTKATYPGDVELSKLSGRILKRKESAVSTNAEQLAKSNNELLMKLYAEIKKNEKKGGRFSRKVKKLIKSPKQFFADSKMFKGFVRS